MMALAGLNNWKKTLVMALGLCATGIAAAQGPTIIGYPANFDAYNNTGAPTHGFEIEADGVNPSQVTRVFGGSGANCYIRYCTGTVTAIPGGVKIRWESPYDPSTSQFTLGTPIPNGTVATGESCWTLGLGTRYSAAGCEHFGISTTVNPTRVVYNWLVEDPATPGALTYYTGPSVPGMPTPAPIPVPIPQPAINLVAPAVAGAAPVLNFDINAPAVPPAQVFQPIPQYGDAVWVKVYKLELANPVDLDELMGGNAKVPEAPMPAETEWTLLQTDPGSHSKRKGLHSGGALGNGSRAVVRRYEHYAYSGAYDPATHQAVCGGDGLCTTPLDGELGVIIGAQNAAANLVVPSVTVTGLTKAGGSVTSTDGKIRCPQTCFSTYNAGTQVTLSVVVPKDNVFTGWGGACSGTQSTCTVAVNDALNVSVAFVPTFTLQVVSRNGSVLGTPYGESPTYISCGSSCSAVFQQGTVVTLTETPAAGVKFTGWSGSCTGTATTCTVTMSAAQKVQANFK